ncbi:OmpH family outer membrane protein [bacterium]|nr:OmpH family outer membrane protein [bacterium]
MKKVFVFVLFVALAFLPQMARAEGIGRVDIDKVVNSFTNAEEFQKQYQDVLNNLQQVLNLHQSNLMLTSQERAEFKQLISKTTLTDSEKQRLQELENIATGRLKELQELENNRNLNDTQKQRLTELQNIRDAASKDIDAIVQEYNNQLNQKREELSKKMESQLREKLAKLGITVKENEDITPYIKQAIDKAIEQVAKENNLSVVLSSQVVFYGGVDITDKVIKALNK